MSRVAKVAIALAVVAVTVQLARRRSHRGSEDVLRAYYAAWSSGDADAGAVAERVESHAGAFDRVDYEVEDVVCRNGEVAARLTMRAHHRETGGKAKTTGLAILRIEDGRIAEEWSSWDYHGLAAQLGLA